jgi:D-aminopeptidase
MKVFVAVDMEGIAGLVQWDKAQGEPERRLMTEEVNAAVRGAFAARATEVLAGESHGNMRNLQPLSPLRSPAPFALRSSLSIPRTWTRSSIWIS